MCQGGREGVSQRVRERKRREREDNHKVRSVSNLRAVQSPPTCGRLAAWQLTAEEPV